MNYQIITDSCCDFTEAQLQQYDVSCASLTVLYNGENHSRLGEVAVVLTVVKNGENHSNFSESAAVKAFYDELRSGTMASTLYCPR